ncbi:hypothetical protein WMY93_005782 [Mugilogobius chulae]|uniref:Uncharacterized protein n=1 Tax=Mugilogobius chulae TaxID=88201 RepID=A0AAW0PRP1_9GOBI
MCAEVCPAARARTHRAQSKLLLGDTAGPLSLSPGPAADGRVPVPLYEHVINSAITATNGSCTSSHRAPRAALVLRVLVLVLRALVLVLRVLVLVLRVLVLVL